MAVAPPAGSEPDPSAHLATAEQASVGTDGILRSASNRDDFDRSFIAQGLIWIYGGAVACAFLVIIGRSVLLAFQHNDDWGSVVRDASDLIKTNILPIVTLILGYYFGRSKP